jgi:hypothetical protein
MWGRNLYDFTNIFSLKLFYFDQKPNIMKKEILACGHLSSLSSRTFSDISYMSFVKLNSFIWHMVGCTLGFPLSQRATCSCCITIGIKFLSCSSLHSQVALYSPTIRINGVLVPFFCKYFNCPVTYYIEHIYKVTKIALFNAKSRYFLKVQYNFLEKDDVCPISAPIVQSTE